MWNLKEVGLVESSIVAARGLGRKLNRDKEEGAELAGRRSKKTG